MLNRHDIQQRIWITYQPLSLQIPNNYDNYLAGRIDPYPFWDRVPNSTWVFFFGRHPSVDFLKTMFLSSRVFNLEYAWMLIQHISACLEIKDQHLDYYTITPFTMDKEFAIVVKS